MSMLRLVTVLTLGAATAAPAQLAITQPTEKLLVLPLGVTSPADSAAAVQAMDIARERLIQLARYKVLTVPKTKICEALLASGFACDILLAEQQASQLARSLSVNAYTTGTLGHNSASYTARIRVSEGSSGFGMIFTATGSTPQILGEAIGQRLNNIVRAAENARECREQRSRGAALRALEAARKAIALEPNLPAAHLCVLSVYEVQRMPADSMIAAARRALVGDSLNATAWNSIAQNYLAKGDTLRAMDAFYSLALTDLKNVGTVRGTAQFDVPARRDRCQPGDPRHRPPARLEPARRPQLPAVQVVPQAARGRLRARRQDRLGHRRVPAGVSDGYDGRLDGPLGGEDDRGPCRVGHGALGRLHATQ